MELSILGPLEVTVAGRRVALGAAKQQAVLGVLLLHAGEVVPVARLIDELWGSDPPPSAPKAVQGYVWRLRRALGAEVIVTRARGYLADVAPDRLDAARFERLAAAGRHGEALALWRGEPLQGLELEGPAAREVERLRERRLAVLEDRIEADLERGLHAELVAELQVLVARHPLRERLRGQAMRALYRAGRQAEALETYREARRRFAEELGLEPSAQLRGLERAILEQAPGLAAPGAAAPDRAPPLAGPPAVPARRLVTAVLADVAAPADPEAAHRLLARLEERGAAAVQGRGGAFNRLVGESFSAVFGLAATREDDAIQAVRAALDLRGAAAALGLALRAGAESGEVYSDGGLVTGVPLRIAARLLAGAAPGEILLGERARGLLGDRVRTAPAAAGAAADGGARLEALAGDRPPPAGPFVGRRRERRALEALLDGGGSCRMTTVLGPPGIGKSRLAREVLDGIAIRAAVVRCAAPGEGAAAQVLDELASALGASLAPGRLEETAWALRRLLAAVAPVAVVVDDLHWAEPVVLDVLDQVVSTSHGASIAILALARPELLERRPAWAVPQPNRSVLTLEALDEADARALAAQLGAAADAAPAIVARAEGNPLFLEQLVALGQDALPPSIQAVLAARLDALPPGERALLAEAAVEGRTFGVDLLAPRADLGAALTALVRRGLIRPDRPGHGEGGAFSFAHALIRDVAYAGLAKQRRAELHERLAALLADRAPDAVIGLHCERAWEARRDIGERAPALAEHGARRLREAARAAHARGDPGASADLLERALALAPDDIDVIVTRGAALREAGRLAEAEAVLSGAIERAGPDVPGRPAPAGPESPPATRARVERELVRLQTDAPATADAAAVAGAALAALAGDELGLCRAHCLAAWVDWTRGRVERADDAWRRAAEHAQRAGEQRERHEVLGWRASAAVFGPLPVADGIRRCREIQDEVRASPFAFALTLHPLAALHAMDGDLARARECVRASDRLLGELGRLHSAVSHHAAAVELLAGRPDRAERSLRAGLERLEAMGERGLLATTAALLARAVLLQGRPAEAAALCGRAASAAAADDLATQVIRLGVQARIDGDAALAQEAVRLAEPTDLLTLRADALADLAATLGADGGRAAQAALELYRRKGDVLSARAITKGGGGAAEPVHERGADRR